MRRPPRSHGTRAGTEIAIATALLVLSAADTASAVGGGHPPRGSTPRRPIAHDIDVWRSDGEPKWVMETGFGVVTSDEPQRYICEGVFYGELESVAALDTDTWLVATYDHRTEEASIYRTEDGCTFERILVPRQTVSHWAVRRDSGEVAFHTAGSAKSIHVSDDGGETFRQLPVEYPGHRYRGLAYAGDGRLVTAAHPYGPDVSAPDAPNGRFIVRGDDDEARRMVPVQKYGDPELLDATGDRILWLGDFERSGPRARERYAILGTLDEPVRETWQLEGSDGTGSLSPDGDAFWVADEYDEAEGVVHGTIAADGTIDWEFVETDFGVRCLEQTGRAIYACLEAASPRGDLQRWGPRGRAFEVVDFTDLAGPASTCPSDSFMAETCAEGWREHRDELLEPPADGPDEAKLPADLAPRYRPYYAADRRLCRLRKKE